MSAKILKIEHEGKTYSGELAVIKSTTLGYEDHGILTSFLHCEWEGGGISAGGYRLDKRGRIGTAFGTDQILRIIETVGVMSWEKLSGRSIIVLFATESNLGSQAVGIAGVHNDKVLVFADHAAQFRNTEGNIE